MQLPLPIELPTYQTLDNYYFYNNELLHNALIGLVGEPADKANIIVIHGTSHSGKTHLATALYHFASAQHKSVCYLDFNELFNPEIMQRFLLMYHADEEYAEDAFFTMLSGYENNELLIIENIDVLADQPKLQVALFDLINRCIEHRTHILISSKYGPYDDFISLPDLRSRLTWGQVYKLDPVDDDGIHSIVLDYVAMKGVNMQPSVIAYLLKFTTRDIKHVLHLIDQLDKLALVEKKAITIPLVKKLLA